MATDPGDLVLDPFGVGWVTGEVAERLGRKWICAEVAEEYLRGAKVRFEESDQPCNRAKVARRAGEGYYRTPHPGLLWDESDPEPLPQDGGRKRPGVKVSEEVGQQRLPEQMELRMAPVGDRQP